MSFWKRFSAKSAGSPPPTGRPATSSSVEVPPTPTEPFAAYGARFALLSLEQQLRLEDLTLGATGWWIDPDQGTLSFKGGPSFDFQYLATVHSNHGIWAWAWDAPATILPPSRTASARRLRALPAAQEIPELTTPYVPTGDAPVQTLAAIAVGLLGAGAHYRTPLNETSAHVVAITHRDLALPAPDAARVQRVLAMFMGGAWGVELRDAVPHYAAARGIATVPSEGGVRLQFEAQGSRRPYIDVRFDPPSFEAHL